MRYWLFPALMLGCLTACTERKAKEDITKQEKSEAVVAIADSSAIDERGYLVREGQMAPDFTMKLTDGKDVRLSDLRGKVVMLQFTASWCGVCRKEMPFIEKDIWLKHKNNPDFVLLGIDRDEPLETVVKFAQQTGVTYPIGLDPNADIFALYADRKAGITRNVIIDRAGKIVMLTRLFDEAEFSQMTREIDSLLSK